MRLSTCNCHVLHKYFTHYLKVSVYLDFEQFCVYWLYLKKYLEFLSMVSFHHLESFGFWRSLLLPFHSGVLCPYLGDTLGLQSSDCSSIEPEKLLIWMLLTMYGTTNLFYNHSQLLECTKMSQKKNWRPMWIRHLTFTSFHETSLTAGFWSPFCLLTCV